MKKVKNLNFSKFPRSNSKSKFPWSNCTKCWPSRLSPCSQVSMSNTNPFLNRVKKNEKTGMNFEDNRHLAYFFSYRSKTSKMSSFLDKEVLHLVSKSWHCVFIILLSAFSTFLFWLVFSMFSVFNSLVRS